MKVIVLLLITVLTIYSASCKATKNVAKNEPKSSNSNTDNNNNNDDKNNNNNDNNNNTIDKTGVLIVDGINETMQFNDAYNKKVDKALSDDEDENKLFSSMSVTTSVALHTLTVGFVSVTFLIESISDIGIFESSSGQIEHKQGEYILTDSYKDIETSFNAESKWTFNENGLSGVNDVIVKNDSGEVVKQSFYDYSYKDGVLYVQSYSVKEDRRNENVFIKSITQGVYTKESINVISGNVELKTCELVKPASIYNNHPDSFDKIKDSNADDEIIEGDNSEVSLKVADKDLVTWKFK